MIVDTQMATRFVIEVRIEMYTLTSKANNVEGSNSSLSTNRGSGFQLILFSPNVLNKVEQYRFLLKLYQEAYPSSAHFEFREANYP
jgi:hypothetical protein